MKAFYVEANELLFAHVVEEVLSQVLILGIPMERRNNIGCETRPKPDWDAGSKAPQRNGFRQTQVANPIFIHTGGVTHHQRL